jgi:hypothetical protein
MWTFLQLAGIASAVTGAILKFGLGGGLIAGGVAAVYVGLAAEQES